MLEIERRVNLMIGEYTMNEYKAYKNLVKHKKRINRVFSEVCGDKSFSSRRPGRKLKMPTVAVASCSAVPLKAPRRRSSKSSKLIIDEIMSSSVQPVKTRSLESTKRKRQTFKQVSDVELQAASSLAQMSRKKAKKAVKKIVLLRFDGFPLLSTMTSSRSLARKVFSLSLSENEFVDVGCFSNVASEVQKEVATVVVAATVATEVVGA
jgi:hypothetical protein